MRRFFYVVSLIMCLSLLMVLSGCTSNQTVKNLWKDTKGYYREYLNTPATLDMEDLGGCTDYEVCLGAAVATVDNQLRALARSMENSDIKPDQAWVGKMLKQYPWISGLAMVDAEGRIIARQPEYSLKEFDASPLLEVPKNQRPAELRAYIQESPLGPEIYLGKPVYNGAEFKGVIIAHFDIRPLMAKSPQPGIFMVATPGVLLWPGIYDAGSTPVAAADWAKLTAGSVTGTVSNAAGSFYWFVKYLGNLPLVYAVPSSGKFPERPEQLEVLENAEALAAPSSSTLLDAPPMRMTGDGTLLEGEVGNVGTPNVDPDLPPGPIKEGGKAPEPIEE